MSKTPHKVALVSHTLGSGGAERFAASLGFMISDLGYEVHNIVVNNPVDYEFSGVLYNLENEAKNQTWLQRKISKGSLLKKYLDDHQIDTIIDNRSRNIFIREWLTKRIYGERKVIYMVHSFRLEMYFPKSVWAARFLYSDAAKLVCVSKAIENSVKSKFGLTNTVTIYNSVEFNEISYDQDLEKYGNYLLYFGRFDTNVKNFDLLLEAFLKSEIYKNGYKLLFLGDGPDKNYIVETAKKLGISAHVAMIPFQPNPFAYVKQAKFTVLTSHFEGFPMSLIESLALRTPVISVDCESGPSEIIQNEINGLLVENYNRDTLANAFKRFVSDANLYDICKTNAKESVKHLSSPTIARKWQQILSE